MERNGKKYKKKELFLIKIDEVRVLRRRKA
jgi:hypothetical protein